MSIDYVAIPDDWNDTLYVIVPLDHPLAGMAKSRRTVKTFDTPGHGRVEAYVQKKKKTPKIIRDAVALEGAAHAALGRYEEAFKKEQEEAERAGYVHVPSRRLELLGRRWGRLEEARELKHVQARDEYPDEFPKHLAERRQRRKERRAAREQA